jgi:hypothetical protein
LDNIIEEFTSGVFEHHDDFELRFDHGVSVRMPLECIHSSYWISLTYSLMI